MKLEFDVKNRKQPDPFIFEDEGRFYLYVTAHDGVEAYSSNDIFGQWHFEGIVAAIDGGHQYWAPSIIKLDGRYYIYFSCIIGNDFEFMHVMSADSPLGPFENPKRLYDYFSIDSHVVKTEAGLFLWFARDEDDHKERVGTRICIDRLLDPYTPEHKVKDMIYATLDEEINTNKYTRECPWHTIEGPFWFCEDGWQYVMYSGACFENAMYHIGYASARTDEKDLTRVSFEKHTPSGKFSPVLIKNAFEEGTGHHSVIKHNGAYYAIYHARDYLETNDERYVERRTARVCKLHVKDGIITAERYEDKV